MITARQHSGDPEKTCFHHAPGVSGFDLVIKVGHRRSPLIGTEAVSSRKDHPLLSTQPPEEPAAPESSFKAHRRNQTDPSTRKLQFQQERSSYLDDLSRCLAVLRERLGDGHPRVGLVLNQMGTHHFRRGDYLSAGKHYYDALKCYERAFTEGHADSDGHSVKGSLAIASTLCNIGAVLCKMGKAGAAVAYLEQALRIQECVSAEWEEPTSGSIELAQTLRKLGVAQGLRGNYRRAMKALLRAQVIFEENCGPFHVDIAKCKDAMGKIHSLQDHPHRALACHQEALRIKSAILNSHHPSVLSSMMNVANMHRRISELEEAESMYWEVLGFQKMALYKAIDPQYRQSVSALIGKTLSLIGEVQRERGHIVGRGMERSPYLVGSTDDWGV